MVVPIVSGCSCCIALHRKEMEIDVIEWKEEKKVGHVCCRLLYLFLKLQHQNGGGVGGPYLSEGVFALGHLFWSYGHRNPSHFSLEEEEKGHCSQCRG